MQFFKFTLAFLFINLLNYIKAHMSQNLIINYYRISFNKAKGSIGFINFC